VGRDADEVLAPIERRIAAAQPEIASLEVARSMLVGVGALADTSAHDGQGAIKSAGRSHRRRGTRRRRQARPARAVVGELKRLLAEAEGLRTVR